MIRMMRPPGFPVMPFVFPVGLTCALMAATAYLRYRTLEALREQSMGRVAPGSR
jgi:hypothetical protein